MVDYTYDIIDVTDPTADEAADIHQQVAGTEWANEPIKKVTVRTAHGTLSVMGFAAYLLNEKSLLDHLPALDETIKRLINSKLGILPPEQDEEQDY